MKSRIHNMTQVTDNKTTVELLCRVIKNFNTYVTNIFNSVTVFKTPFTYL